MDATQTSYRRPLPTPGSALRAERGTRSVGLRIAGGNVARDDGPTEEPARLLVAGNDIEIIGLLRAALCSAGYQVRVAGSGDEALTMARGWRPDLFVLDSLLPDKDGFTVARELRGQDLSAPVIFLVPRGESIDNLAGLTVRGHDCLTKPFSLEDLTARVRTTLRRLHADGRQRIPLQPPDGVLKCAYLELHEDNYRVLRSGRPIQLSPTEFALLRYLMHNVGSAVTRAQIVDRVWHYEFAGDRRIVESYICALRRKVNLPGRPLIHTVRGVGYCLRPPSG